MEQEVQRSYWIDAAKLVAILGVLVDHTQNVLYSNHRIADCSYYSVGLFIFLMGVTGYGSYSRYRGSIPEKLKKNFWKIARPYLVATFIFSIAQDGQFIFLAFWKRLLYFNASAPFYYVALYLQLMVVIPVFAALLRMTSTKKGGIFLEMLVFGATVVLSAWTTNHSNILDIYGGG
ncbi:MAG: acyltransferase family protein, partial [Lachnospiraceae bacterium]|nr:acyltransferase family protein [Lachnospiraceae bacterium]